MISLILFDFNYIFLNLKFNLIIVLTIYTSKLSENSFKVASYPILDCFSQYFLYQPIHLRAMSGSEDPYEADPRIFLFKHNCGYGLRHVTLPFPREAESVRPGI